MNPGLCLVFQREKLHSAWLGCAAQSAISRSYCSIFYGRLRKHLQKFASNRHLAPRYSNHSWPLSHYDSYRTIVIFPAIRLRWRQILCCVPGHVCGEISSEAKLRL